MRFPRVAATFALVIALSAACSQNQPDSQPPATPAPLPSWTFNASMIFPADSSLNRPEDGVLLPDGRLIVADEVHGLRLVESDGRSAPFGDMPGAGYSHKPPTHPGGANGVSFEPGGAHVLVADVHGGGIFRVNAATGATERIYQHEYGVNAAIRDARGTIWFTQSAHNTPAQGMARLWAAIEKPGPEGALYRLPQVDGRLATSPELVLDGLRFANGLAMDEAAAQLYVAEILAPRVLRFPIDKATGKAGAMTVFLDGVGADNIELDGRGHVWMALPLSNTVMVASTDGGPPHTAFQSLNEAQRKRFDEVARRSKAGEPLPPMTPEAWEPLPGLITGVILDRSGMPAYFTGLGKALIRVR